MPQNGALAENSSLLAFATQQEEARQRAAGFMEAAALAGSAKEAADWSLAAKNAMAVALICEQIAKTRRAQ